MTRTEHLLTIFGEECSEVHQRASKALRFGVEEVQPGQPLTNGQRIVQELVDLQAMCDMLQECGVIAWPTPAVWKRMKADKREKVEAFLKFSASRGTVDGVRADHTVPHPEAELTLPPCARGLVPHAWNEKSKGCVACGITQAMLIAGY